MPEFVNDKSENNRDDGKGEVLPQLGRHSPQKLTVTLGKFKAAFAAGFFRLGRSLCSFAQDG